MIILNSCPKQCFTICHFLNTSLLPLGSLNNYYVSSDQNSVVTKGTKKNQRDLLQLNWRDERVKSR